MIKRKRVYICDHCGSVGLETEYQFFSIVGKMHRKVGQNLAKRIYVLCVRRFMRNSSNR